MKLHLKRSTIAVLCAVPLLAAGIAAAVSSGGTSASTAAAAPGNAGAAPAPAPAARPVLLTGEVEALDTQTIVVPPSNSSPLVLRNFVAEGTPVKAGDLVLRIETGGAANIDRLKTDLDRAIARVERETATLEAGAIDTEKALISAEAALAKAKVDAALPKQQIAALNYDRNQAELDRATRDLAVKLEARDNYRQSVLRRREDGELEVKKMQINLAFQTVQLKQSEVRAARDGVVVHGYSPWKGERFEEGSSAWPGNAAGVVQGDGQMAVTAWVLEADRPYLSEGQELGLRFDALPGAALTGKIKSITSAPEARASWGNGRYFRVRIALPEGHGLPLVAGMSVFAEPHASAGAANAAHKPAGAAEPLTVEGEIASRQALPVSPPTIPYVWQYKLASIAPEGSLVNAGQPIAQFESGEVTTQLMQHQGQLREKQRALEKLQLDQAEADRAGELAVAEAQSNAEKAERKASQPKELIRRVDYDKLVIERTEKTALAKLTVEQRAVQIRARRAELTGLQAEVADLQQQLDALTRGQAALTVLAPRKGLVMYRTTFSGEKFAVGSQVWMGLSVATLADPDQLYVNATIPEAQASNVRIGQQARVTVPGANQALSAHVVALGRAFHGKSTAQSTIVRDLELQFDGAPAGLKPGAAVQAALVADAHGKEHKQ
ncbi:HlyD family efflux transporter periplasmic adaptor subunit [Rugamonas sp. FT107W]|uniref:HlyD family efflux transporter periplasmic adaptor subunit n=1 Tax=Duganella vulcania TaxID=2692166 RepID=A0A845HHU3_9BURK|nr:HlyD family efflux transporter periplasmic adaptor subunit [Duganella vulcania]MYN18321.1 HlyD family efflux transporter periplasmic adaptor subunit [Duganella vulcania]